MPTTLVRRYECGQQESHIRAFLLAAADVKELIPEFYSNPEFLLNSNAFDLGTRQDSTPLGGKRATAPLPHGSHCPCPIDETTLWVSMYPLIHPSIHHAASGAPRHLCRPAAVTTGMVACCHLPLPPPPHPPALGRLQMWFCPPGPMAAPTSTCG